MSRTGPLFLESRIANAVAYVERLDRRAWRLAGAVICSALIASTIANAAPTFEVLGRLPEKGSSLPLDVSADGSVVVGRVFSPPAGEAFLWTSTGGIVPLPFAQALGVSDDGNVVVGFTINNDNVLAVRWTSLEGLVVLGNNAVALDASADGSVVVGTSAAEAAVWREGTGLEIRFFTRICGRNDS